MENRLDDLFKEKLARHEEKPSHAAWDQIHGQLRSKKRAVLGKRLAMAASIVILVSVGYFGYDILKNFEGADNSNAISLNSDVEEIRDSVEEQAVTKIEEQTHSSVEDVEDVRITKEIQPVIEAGISQSKTTEIALAETINSAQKEEALKKETESATTEVLEIPEESSLAENETTEIVEEEKATEEGQNEIKNVEIEAQEEEPKTYPKVKIIYRASQNSELVASGKTSIINKGINKITEFSEEHLLTDHRKTKLRNTKDDLLALNFGKLLNKSNRELEN